MVVQRRQSTRQRVARLGRAMYAKRVRRRVRGERKGRVVALDVHSGDFEVGDSVLEAAERLLERRPDAEVWLERVGYPTLAMMRMRRISGVKR
jgi:hypothetical protein